MSLWERYIELSRICTDNLALPLYTHETAELYGWVSLSTEGLPMAVNMSMHAMKDAYTALSILAHELGHVLDFRGNPWRPPEAMYWRGEPGTIGAMTVTGLWREHNAWELARGILRDWLGITSTYFWWKFNCLKHGCLKVNNILYATASVVESPTCHPPNSL
jgi:hypothetical protein